MGTGHGQILRVDLQPAQAENLIESAVGMNHKEIERWHRRRNIKRAAQFLVLSAILLLVTGYSASRYLHSDTDDFSVNSDPNAGITIKKFSYSSPGAHPWELEAASAMIAESLDKVNLHKPKVVYHGGKGGKIFLIADTGDLDKQQQTVLARGNVTVKYEDLEFAADNINYSQEKQTAQTQSEVSLKGADFQATGKGLKMRIQEEEITIENDVKARLFDVKWIETNKVTM
jgi:LPS export ABC transporter protein LptC